MDSTSVIDKCAACGKEGDGLKFCNGCKSVKYCSRDCQAAHRPLHKKACKKRAAEIYDEKLFVDTPPREECPLCMLPLQDADERLFKSCCGKVICCGCILAMTLSEGKDLCAFCRTPPANSYEERIKRAKKLMDKGNGEAYYELAGYYARGLYGLPRDYEKVNDLLLKGGELGCAEAYYNLGNNYSLGKGVAIDKKKAKHYYELAAMGGDVSARHNLGIEEMEAGNIDRALKHWMIAAKAGYEESLNMVKQGYMYGDATKDVYASTLRGYQNRQDEMKSDTRDMAREIFARQSS